MRECEQLHQCGLRISVNQSQDGTAVAQVGCIADHYGTGRGGHHVPLEGGVEVAGFDRFGHC